MILLPIVIFIFGLLIGSFLNVVILRINTGRSIVSGRSKCARCNRTLEWYELLPVISFFALRGKCRTCKAPISFQYATVELLTAIAFTALYAKIVIPLGFTSIALVSFIGACAAVGMLIVIFVYDLYHKIIPDLVVYPLIVLSLIFILAKWAFVPGFALMSTLYWGVAVALPFFLLWFFSDGKLMGFGDVKLMLALGWLLGSEYALTGLLISFWIGGIFGIGLLLLSKKYSMKSEIPFAPFLIIGAAAAYFFAFGLTTFFPYI